MRASLTPTPDIPAIRRLEAKRRGCLDADLGRNGPLVEPTNPEVPSTPYVRPAMKVEAAPPPWYSTARPSK